MKRLLCLVPMLALMGCASAGPNLRQQVADLEARAAQDDKQLKELEMKLALSRAQNATGNLSQAGKDAMESFKAIWAAEGVSEHFQSVEKKAYDCYQRTDLSQLHTWEDYKALVFNCWHDAGAEGK